MRLLLDTNAYLRLVAGSRLPARVHRALAKASNEFFFSIVSAWEIAIKPDLGLSPAAVETGVSEMGGVLLPIRLSHLTALTRLPMYREHRDPFDRLLIAQAVSEDLTMISSDTRFSSYAGLRVLWD